MNPISNADVEIIRRTAIRTAVAGEKPSREVAPGAYEGECWNLGTRAREIERLLAELLLRREGKASLRADSLA